MKFFSTLILALLASQLAAQLDPCEDYKPTAETNTLLAFFMFYQQEVPPVPDDWPDIQPSSLYYYQDIGGGGSVVGNWSTADGELIAEDDPFVHTWTLNGEATVVAYEPQLLDFFPDGELSCDGVMQMELHIEHTPTGASSRRLYAVYFAYNDLSICQDDQSLQFDISGQQILVNCGPHRFLDEVPWSLDLDGSGFIDVGDLLIILARF